MDSFLGTLVFLLPGLMLYFWLQSFGINPVVKHSPAEFTAVSVLLWFPVSLTVILTFNLFIHLTNWNTFQPIWSTEELKTASGSFVFLIIFLGSSVLISFLAGAIWAKWIHQQLFMKLINGIRKSRGAAEFSRNTSVWEEIFTINGEKVVKIIKLDKPEEYIVGSIRKASRQFEPERNIVLDEVDYFTKLVEKYNPTIKHVFIDTKSGIAIYMYHPNSITEVQLMDHKSENPIISPWCT
ncbi:hypothetical protein ACFRCQ_08325 [Cytobacillus firmus]|uniref:hypothetical protein n=1 Tax=Cytobacillus firmus TaxID=1399 RepID=UPI00369473A5